MRLGDEGGSGIKDELLRWSNTEESLLFAIKLEEPFSRFAIVFSASMSSHFVLQLSPFSSFPDFSPGSHFFETEKLSLPEKKKETLSNLLPSRASYGDNLIPRVLSYPPYGARERESFPGSLSLSLSLS